MLLAVSCLQDPVAPSNEAVMPTVSYDKDTQTRVSVVLSGSIPANVPGLADYGFEVVEGGFSTGTSRKYSAKEQYTNAFSCLATVTPNKHYEIRSFYTNGQQTKYSDAITFDAPSTSAAELSDVTYVGGKLTANIIDNGGREINEVGFCWAQEEDIRAIRRSSKHMAELNADGSFSLDFLGLRPGEVYYVLAYAENSDSDAEAVGYSRKPFILVVTEDDFVDIEDANFAAYLISNFDTNRDGKMSYREMKAITTIDVSTDNIASVREISLMPDLTRLSVAARNRGTGKLKKMDVSYNSKLTTIICDNNKLDSVVVRNIPMLDTLSCYRNQMTEIDVSSNPLLSYLDCGNNQILELGDLSPNKELKHLDFRGNLVKEVDISPCLAIREFNATSCPSLKIIYVWPDFFDETEDHRDFYKDDTAEYVISPNAPIVIPDPNFRKYCIEHFDTDKNGEVSYKEAKDATRIDVCTDDIETLKGIAFFTSLTYLRCYGTVSDDSFVIRNGRLTSLDVSGQTELDTLDCSGNQLNSLNVSVNTRLSLLNCAGNSLSTLDLSGNSRLTDLDFKGNQVASIALSGNTALLRLDCSKNKLIALDVSKNVALKEFNCSGNRIPVLVLSDNKEITWLDCSSNALQEMNIIQNRKLSYLDCTNNPLATIYLYANQVVTTLRKPEGTKLFYLIDNISILPETVSLKVEETCTLTAVIEPSDAIDKTVVWKSSDEKVAAVSDAGVVTAKTVGSCDITATCGGKTATRSVYVNPIPVEEIVLSQDSLELTVGESQSLIATVLPDNATDKTVSWLSDNESVATISSSGLVTAVSSGSCVVSAKAGAQEAICLVTVKKAGVFVAINIENFPDAIFREYVRNSFDTDNDGSLSEQEIQQISSISVREMSIETLEGIAFFSSLTKIYCGKNRIQSLDVSRNEALTVLECNDNQLVGLNVSNNLSLSRLSCGDNSIATLDLSKNEALTYLECCRNGILELDLRSNKALSVLSCNENQMIRLDISSCKDLYHLYCSSNSLNRLDVSNCPSLDRISCHSNQLIELDVSNNPKLTLLECANNPIISLDTRNNFLLAHLNCSGNKLSNLDLSQNAALTDLLCQGNSLTVLNVDNNTELIYMDCRGNLLSILDVSNNAELSYLDCRYCTNLTEIWLKTGQTIDDFSYDTSVATIKYK